MRYHVRGYVAYQLLVSVDFEIEADNVADAKSSAVELAAGNVSDDAEYQFDSLLCEELEVECPA